MFSTILMEVTGYFDRRVLVSTFFPSLVFLGGGILLVLLADQGAARVLAGWNRQPGTVQALIVGGLLVLVAFWTFALVNLRDVIDRLYQGYWPDTGVAAAVARRRRHRFERRRAELLGHDQTLEDRAAAVRRERAGFPTQDEVVAGPPAGDEAAAAVEVDHALGDLATRLGELERADAAAAWPHGLARRLGDAWRRAAPYVGDADPADDTPWGGRLARLNDTTKRLHAQLDRLDHELAERRLELHRDLFLFYPAESETVMPTALGNVVKSAERYPWHRYRLDAVVVWPRLAPLLPTESATLLQDAKTSLDLLLTLATFTWLFGVPLAAWTVVRAAWPAGAPAVTVLAALGLVGAVPPLVGRQTRGPARLGAAATLAVAAVTLAVAPQQGRGPDATARAGVFLLLATGLVLLAWALYRNAVLAGLRYGEQIKAVFDLHRWRVLDQFHLRTPPDLGEEQTIWEQLCALLYRGTPPDPRYYQYVEQDQTKPPVTAAGPSLPVWVPARDLPAYRPVAADDLVRKDFPVAEVSVGSAEGREELAGRHPLVPLSAGQPVPRRVLVDPGRLDGIAAISVVAAAAGGFWDSIGVGDLVDLIALRRAALGRDRFGEVFENLLVLGVRPLSSPDDRLELVVALPLTRRARFVAATRRGTVLLSRKVVLGDT